MEKVRVGVVGVGHLGRFHAQNYAQIAAADLIGVYDVDSETAQRVASEFGCDSFSDQGELLKQVDAVSVAVPTDLHFDVGRVVIEGGVHCLMEKPIAQDLKQADGLIRLAEEKGCILQVGHVERFNPAFRALEGVSLRPRFVDAQRLAPYTPRGTEVSVVLDLMIHDIDVVLHLVKSPIQSMDASGAAVVSDTVDIANARIRFENGCVANLATSRVSLEKVRMTRIFQDEAYIAVDFLDRVSEIYRLGVEASGDEKEVGEMGAGERKCKVLCRRPKAPQEGGLYRELEAFVQTILGEKPQAVTGEEARAALSVAMDVERMIES